MKARTLEPEWLDSLPERDARAQHSRRDLVRVNALMGSASIVARLLRERLPARPLRIAEIGSGDGAFAASVVRRLGREGEILLVDRATGPAAETVRGMADRGWRVEPARGDVFDWLAATPRLDAIFANLFLHHFDDRALGRMLHAIAARAPLFVACEPRRSNLALFGARLLGVVGCNDVTRHDAVVSVRAGFAGREISALWPESARARLEECARGVFSHAFRAQVA